MADADFDLVKSETSFGAPASGAPYWQKPQDDLGACEIGHFTIKSNLAKKLNVRSVRKAVINTECSERLVPVKAAIRNKSFEFSVANGGLTRHSRHSPKNCELPL
ncbi:hypothetical protein [Sulfitobacter sp. JL08]|uniref:hypothetical protein n=1 Tax=unclassified Sulfitobacter TaxID=196795 RepID=UPI0013B47683|nr:hypothetical protein [Sulfitobacter sp. JL08]